jgi:hypothetical protein
MQAAMIAGEIARDNWKPFLDEFSKRNELRPTRIEVIGGDLGAQEAEQHLPLLGISFEPKGSEAGSVEIVLGGTTSADERHFEHLVLNVRRIVPITGTKGIEDGLGFEDNEDRKTLVLFESLTELPPH